MISAIDSLAGLRLGLADVADAVDDLALQVGLVDLVELGDAERADAGRGQVEQRRAAEAAGADDEHLGVLQPLLPGHPDVGDDQVAAVAAYLVDGELGGRLDQRRERHGVLLDWDRVDVRLAQQPPTTSHVPRAPHAGLAPGPAMRTRPGTAVPAGRLATA